MKIKALVHGLLASTLASLGCSDAGNNLSVGGAVSDAGVRAPAARDAGPMSSRGAGVCASPHDLAAEGAREGNALVFRGSTAGMADALHPYGECIEHDGAEAVFSYRVPAGVRALQVSTEGSEFDTAVYVRGNCSQASGGADLACNNDSYEHAPASLLYVTNLIEGAVIFIVVDANVVDGGEHPSQGRYVLTVREVPLGAQGMPCRPEDETSRAPRCDGALRCSGGAGADGSALCVPTVAATQPCDPRGYDNTCVENAWCVTDPSPPEGAMPAPTCATAGSRAGAPCREAEPRCDGALVCGAGENPVCVRVIGLGMGCDPTGAANQCSPALRCSPLGDAGGPICHPL